MRGLAQDSGRKHRVKREGDVQGDGNREGYGEAELIKEAPHLAFHEGNRHKHRHDGEGGGEDRERYLAGGKGRRLAPGHALFDVAHDVFLHHDGVVNQKANGKGERQQGHHVLGEAEGIHENECSDNGGWDDERANECAAQVSQEDPHNEYCQPTTE